MPSSSYLQSRRVTRAEDIARKFNITIRTAYRDLAALGEAGVPITAQGGVGYSILKGFHLQPVTFTADEAGALTLGGLLVQQFAGSAFTEHMSSALLKIRAILPQQIRDHMEVLEESMRPLRSPALDSRPSTLDNLGPFRTPSPNATSSASATAARAAPTPPRAKSNPWR